MLPPSFNVNKVDIRLEQLSAYTFMDYNQGKYVDFLFFDNWFEILQLLFLTSTFYQ